MARRVFLWLLGLLVSAAISYAASVALGFLPPEVADLSDPRRAACIARETIEDRYFPPKTPTAGRVRVLVARLDGDTDGQQTRRLMRDLETISIIEPDELCRAVRVPIEGPKEERVRMATAAAREIARARKAELIVYGERDVAQGVVRLAFAGPNVASGKGLADYDLGARALLLPESLAGELGALVVSVILADTAPASDSEQGGFFTDTFPRALQRLDAVLADPKLNLTPDTIKSLKDAQADLLFWLGSGRGDKKMLERSLNIAREFLKDYPRERMPQNWARIEGNLAAVLVAIGELETTTTHLEEAIAAYRQALQEEPRERFPDRWNFDQGRLADALSALGEREAGTERLEESIKIYRDVLKTMPSGTLPIERATVLSNFGDALQHLDARRNDNKLLEEAIAAYRDAVNLITRASAPRYWAYIHGNLGVTLARLGEREVGTSHLEEAISAFQEALKELSRERNLSDWGTIQNNFAFALRILGERRHDRTLVQQAIDAELKALDAARATNSPANVRIYEKNLEIARAALDKLQVTQR